MGIAVKNLLALEYFRDFYVIAGHSGLDREIQGVTILEAPDATRWTKGKELILSSGYVMMQDPLCLHQAFEEGNMQKISAFMLKRDRYVTNIDPNLIALFDKYHVPLISMPFTVPWMELMNQINTAVMNQTIRRFQIHNDPAFQISNESYKRRKIQKILQAVESEMKFPALLYDLTENECYYSSHNFKRSSEEFNLTVPEYLKPSKPYTKHTLCDNIGMARIRLLNENGAEGPRVSWITVPISVGDVELAYFVVMESKEFIDYYDEYSIRIAYLMLQGIYEQIMVAQSVGNIGFENLVYYYLHNPDAEVEELTNQASLQGIPVNGSFTYVLFKQINPDISARSNRDSFTEAFHTCIQGKAGNMAFLEDNEGFLLLPVIGRAEESRSKDYQSRVIRWIRQFEALLQKKCSGIQLIFSIFSSGTILQLKESLDKCERTFYMGRLLYPNQNIWDYSMLGPLIWLQIPDNELEQLLSQYRALAASEKNREVLRTLKIYLENNQNYSLTAEKMFVHINTIRKRIDRAQELIPLDFTDHIECLKQEILLQFLKL